MHRAARDVGARVIVVVHDERPHSIRSGTEVGLRGVLRRADVLVAHTAFVGEAVARGARRSVVQIPHPMQVGMLARSGGVAALTPGDDLLGLHFGTLRRRYKGSDVVAQLRGARPGVDLRGGRQRSADEPAGPRSRTGVDRVGGSGRHRGRRRRGDPAVSTGVAERGDRPRAGSRCRPRSRQRSAVSPSRSTTTATVCWCRGVQHAISGARPSRSSPTTSTARSSRSPGEHTSRPRTSEFAARRTRARDLRVVLGQSTASW